jgi:hypothetical protein
MRQVASVDDKIGRRGQAVNFDNRFLQRTKHVLVRFLIKPDVTVADLHKIEAGLGCVGSACAGGKQS